MGTGDITVVGMVAESHLIEDIGVLVPQGVAVTIPGPMTLMSKDLHRGISQRFIMRVYDAPAPVKVGLGKEERDRYETEIQRLRAQEQALKDRNRVLETQVDALNAELSALRAKDAKLDAILTAIQERPAVVQQVVHAAPVAARGPVTAPEEKVDGDAPMFIPSTIKPEGVEERVAVQEETTSSSVSAAASKLKSLRKNKT